MDIFIKNMVCSRCLMVVKNEILRMGLHPTSVELGEVTIAEALSAAQKEQLDHNLRAFGFELISDRKSKLIEKIKTEIVKLVYGDSEQPKTNFSTHIASLLHYDYNYLSNLFTEVEGTTIEHYFISQKIERVKELLVYDELSLNEIAMLMNYSSAAYLSRQFKKNTGLTPSHFKQIGQKKRRPIEEL